MSEGNGTPPTTDDLVDQAISDVTADDAVRTPPKERLEVFVDYPLGSFLEDKILWAANYFVLWPLGLALIVNVDRDPETKAVLSVTNIGLRHWQFPDGELGETINESPENNQADYEIFLSYVRRRLGELKPEERRLLLSRYEINSVASAQQIIVAK